MGSCGNKGILLLSAFFQRADHFSGKEPGKYSQRGNRGNDCHKKSDPYSFDLPGLCIQRVKKNGIQDAAVFGNPGCAGIIPRKLEHDYL